MRLHLQLVDGDFTSAANDVKFGWLIGGLLNFNKYMYQNIFHHTLYIFQRPKWNKQCWLNPSRMSWASAGRRWLRFVIKVDDWGADHMNIAMSLRNLFLVWTLRFLVATMPVYAATPPFLCWPYLWWDICFAMNPVWLSPTSLWKNWSPLLSFFMAVATGSYITLYNDMSCLNIVADRKSNENDIIDLCQHQRQCNFTEENWRSTCCSWTA